MTVVDADVFVADADENTEPSQQYDDQKDRHEVECIYAILVSMVSFVVVLLVLACAV